MFTSRGKKKRNRGKGRFSRGEGRAFGERPRAGERVVVNRAKRSKALQSCWAQQSANHLALNSDGGRVFSSPEVCVTQGLHGSKHQQGWSAYNGARRTTTFLGRRENITKVTTLGSAEESRLQKGPSFFSVDCIRAGCPLHVTVC